MKKNTPASRIAIIGAGAAGLTAAELLRQKGYQNVTLFERAERVGGKCSTVEIDGRRHELGAGIIAEDNAVVVRLARQFGVRMERVDFSKRVQVHSEDGTVLPKKSIFYKSSFFKELLLTYRKLVRTHPNIIEPGLSQMDPDLCLPFAEWVKKHGLELLAQELEGFFTGYGYGYYKEVPAVYALKYYSWSTVQSFMKRQIYRFPDGIQHLWTSVAKQHDLILNTTISNIERGDQVTITTEKGARQFDALIIASPLDEALNYMDAAEQERELFSKILYVDYRTIACAVEGLPNLSGYVPGNYSRQRAGHPVFWYHRHADSTTYTFYVLGDWKISDQEVTQNTKELVEKMGGQVKKVHTIAHWKYFPHVSPEVMRGGYFDRLEARQGAQKTYYAGELLNFSTVGLTAAYSEQLINRYF